MKKLFTLAAATSLAAASFAAQAQTVDGVLSAGEIGTGSGQYQLLGKYTNPRGFGDAGLLSLYAASTGTKLYIFVGGTVEANGNAFQLFLDLPGVAGVPVGTALPAGSTGTSFQNVTFKLDLAADLALALRADDSATPAVPRATRSYKIEGISYVGSPTTASSQNLTTAAAQLMRSGAPVTIPATTAAGPGLGKLAGMRTAYRADTTVRVTGAMPREAQPGVSVNPGNTTPNTGAAYGAAGTYGWEIEIDRATAGLTTGMVNVFVVQNNGDGGYASSDFIPQTSAPLAANNGNLASGAYDFTALPDPQSAAIALRPLGTRAADESAVAMGVFPNPAQGRTTVSYQVTKTEAVNVVLTDLMGRTVRTLENSNKSAGIQNISLNTADVAAGTYLVRVQVGDKVAVRKVVLL